VPDPSIRALYARLEEVLGAQHADTLMTRLPPPLDELARQAEMVLRFDDINRKFEAVGVRFDHLEQRFDGLEQRFDGLERRFERLEDRFDHLDQSMHHMFEVMQKHLKSNTTMMVTAMTALTAIYGGMLVAFVA
jgi:predicted nuclease with TOPRIM domain